MKVPAFIQSCWRRRWFRALTWLVASLVTLLVLIYQYYNWAGARSWAKVRAEVAATGESLEYRAVVPNPVPDERNFGALPVFKNLTLGNRQAGASEAEAVRQALRALTLPDAEGPPRPKLGNGLNMGQKTDLAAWLTWLKNAKAKEPILLGDSGDPARDILKWMAARDAMVQEIAKGLDRPEAQWTPAWKTRDFPAMMYSLEVPHYDVLNKMGTWFALRAVAAAHVGDAKVAHESLLILTRLAEATQHDPILIGTLVSIAQTTMLAQALWEVCAARVGTVEDFQRLGRAVGRLKPSESLLVGERAEMTMAVTSVQSLKGQEDEEIMIALLGHSRGKDMAPAVRLIPDGWFDANLASLITLHLKYFIRPLRDEGLASCIDRQPELEALLTDARANYLWNPNTILAQLALPALRGVIIRTAYIETLVMQMKAACALESHFLQSQSYPTNLEELKAEGYVVPLDPLNRQPLRYQKLENGQYRLWTAGVDRKDDEGKRVLDAKNPESTKYSDEKYQGDWVWERGGK